MMMGGYRMWIWCINLEKGRKVLVSVLVSVASTNLPFFRGTGKVEGEQE